MNELAAKKCEPCDQATDRLKGQALTDYQNKLGANWKVEREHHLEKKYKFKDFREALNFTNQVGELAEKLQHHPDILLKWGEVTITIFTHKIDGLTENDFVLAAKIGELPLAKNK